MFAALAAAAAAWPAHALAAAGDLDPSFSGDGRVSVPSAGAFVPRAMDLQPDGRIVVAGASCDPAAASRDGTCLNDGGSSFRLARFTPDGGLDTEFGDGGFVTTNINQARSQAFDVLALPSGAIVAGGVARDLTGRDVLALVRYDTRGALDPTFGTDGIALQPAGDGFAAIGDIERGPDDTILVTGQAAQRMVVARFTASGALDTSFGTGGMVIAGPAYGFGLGLAAVPGGGVVAAGIAGDSADPSTYRFGELRLTAGGMPDTGFGVGGFAEQYAGTSSSFANALAPTADGGWLAAGAGTVADGRQAIALVKGDPGNAPVPAWSSLVASGQGVLANDVVALPDGRAVVAGQVAPDTGGLAFAVARVGRDGRLDPTWGTNGLTAIGWERYPFARATALALQPDGRLLTAGLGCAGGSGGTRCTGGTAVLLLTRQLPDGPAGPGPPPNPVPNPDVTKPAGRLSGRPQRIDRRALERRGVAVRVKASEPVRLDVTLTGTRRGARRREVRIAHVKLTRYRGTTTFRMRPWRRALGRTRAGTLRLQARLTDRAGNTITLRTRVKLR